MDFQCRPSSPSLYPKTQKYCKLFPPWAECSHHIKSTKDCFFKYKICGCKRQQQDQRKWLVQRPFIAKAIRRGPMELTEEKPNIEVVAKNKGSIVGAIALIIGTTIGSGILALPQKASSAKKKEEKGELDVISIRTMAQETLGDWGGNLATMTCCFFTAIFSLLISFGGTAATDQVNQWLTASMIGLLLAIEVVAVVFGGWSGFEGSGDWGKVPSTIPVIIFSLVYHDLAPVLCAYLGGDLPRLRTSVLLGSLVPMLILLVWDAIALGLSAHTDQVVDPVELLMSVRWSGVSYLVEAFSLLAVGTSLIGTLLGFSEFFKEQLKNLSSTTQISLQEPNKVFGLRNWWGRNKISLTAMTIVIAPTLLVSTTVPDAFSAATDFAGGYCMTMLYGVLPPAMAWAMHDRELREDNSEKVLSRARPALVGLGVFACGIVVEQILQDFSALHL
ncbi:hypothetical protein JCGZ_18541 [Jatropha curcas]|uniref:Uncharacterized protein n=1 Tax=Jatropha curcas TaxID=180498 RepID=A0A067LL63_JATCU|nr:hypothetical protein JCGZ_18541 [Jatropha curcas]